LASGVTRPSRENGAGDRSAVGRSGGTQWARCWRCAPTGSDLLKKRPNRNASFAIQDRSRRASSTATAIADGAARLPSSCPIPVPNREHVGVASQRPPYQRTAAPCACATPLGTHVAS
jgi:hypothetical protein